MICMTSASPYKTNYVMSKFEKLGQKHYNLVTVNLDLKRRLWKIAGVPITYISKHGYNMKKMPDDYRALML
ncbi:hypothetical protein E2I00_006120 [Balaenoptera physalus]|uniref:Uncharacterized protein n=1 Tax=Balaenoptera physalus TaxID=9770 RepID=A0A643AT55_BALPH|nr:hypothetical protein E2I00_006120 [Balaenoptera physalus]